MPHPHLMRRLAVAAALPAFAAFALPAAAGASVANVNGTDLQILDGGGEDNIVSVSQLADGRLLVKDTRVVSPGQGCVTGFGGAVCSGANRITALLRGGDDSLLTTASVPIRYAGGEDDDVYEGGQATGNSHVTFVGGSGRDTASYTTATRGVTVTKDGRENDGRAGADRDSIAPDVEDLFGSRHGDSLNGSNDAVTERFTGLGGDDVLSGNGGPDFFLTGSTADGADRMFGGGDRDTVLYDARARPVTVTLSDGGADDGEAGEGDELRQVEQAAGGSAGDTLKAHPASPVGVQLNGNGGADTITGTDADGPGIEERDLLRGGPGRDTITALDGGDTVIANDGEVDSVSCGQGLDAVVADRSAAVLDLMSGCESVQVGTLRLAPSGRSAAGSPPPAEAGAGRIRVAR